MPTTASTLAPPRPPEDAAGKRPCPYCGIWNRLEFAFCQKCGRQLPSLEETAPPAATPPAAPPPPQGLPPPPSAVPSAWAVPPPPPAAPVAVAARPGVDPMPLGRPDSTTRATASISLDVSDFPFTYYLRQLQAKISERWAPPRPATAGGERAVIMFEIGRDGSIREPVLEKGSGNALYDQSALRAIAEASPFPPLPVEFKSSSLRVHFGFDFQPDRG